MSQPPHEINTKARSEKIRLGRDCIVFLPGMGGSASVDQTVEGLARRLAAALDKNAEDDTAIFESRVRALKDFGPFKGELGSIYRKDERGESVVIDIYKLDYRGTLIGGYEDRNLFKKTILLLQALPGTLLRILKALLTGKPSKTRPEKIQLLYALGILCLLVIYVVILFSALLVAIQSVPGVGDFIQQATGRIKWLSWVSQLTSGWLKLAPVVVVLGAVIAIFLPPKFKLKDAISKAAVDYLCLIYYLNLGEQRNTIVGRLEALIDEISRKSEKERKKGSGDHYRHIHLLTYSFGSIVALDAMFPAERRPGRPLKAIHTLVTIGCPFDFVRTFWANYFGQHREYEKNQPVQWLNVYSPIDVLASNFRNDSDKGEATINIRSEQASTDADVPAPVNISFREGLNFAKLSYFNSLTLIGLRSHSMYWSTGQEAEVNCFGDLVRKLYEGSDVLS